MHSVANVPDPQGCVDWLCIYVSLDEDLESVCTALLDHGLLFPVKLSQHSSWYSMQEPFAAFASHPHPHGYLPPL